MSTDQTIWEAGVWATVALAAVIGIGLVAAPRPGPVRGHVGIAVLAWFLAMAAIHGLAWGLR